VTGMLAPDGRCKTLDAAAEGYVRAEAVGAIWLRCLKSVAGLTLGPNKPVSMVPPSFEWPHWSSVVHESRVHQHTRWDGNMVPCAGCGVDAAASLHRVGQLSRA
jgi:hypothetical protein